MGSLSTESSALTLHTVQNWAYLPVLVRIVLAVALGLFVGMERERRGKEAGVRTFAFVALLGCLCALLGDTYAFIGMGLVAVLVVFLNWQRLQTNQTAELTTSIALLVTGVLGILCGKGHTFTPVVVGIVTAALLTWKESMTHFSVGLTEAEIRSAILLGILAFIVYPVLPNHAIDPWGMIEPRSAWVTVLLIAAIGFINYILLKLYGTRGAVFAGFLGGLVNSTVVAAELATRVHNESASAPVKDDSPLVNSVYQGVLLANAAMVLRNIVLLCVLSFGAFVSGALIPLVLMMATCAGLAFWQRPGTSTDSPKDASSALGTSEEESNVPESKSPAMRLESPFSLTSALKFGVVFLILHVAGTLAQHWLGVFGFYAVSAAGGVVSSSSAVASAGSLAVHQAVSLKIAGEGAVIASFTSALTDAPLVARVAHQKSLTKRVSIALVLVAIAGLIGIAIQVALSPVLAHAFAALPASK